MTGADIYMKTCKEKALEWNVSPRSVSDMCKKGRIQGAIKEKGSWLIPDDSPKPMDGRVSNGKYIKKNMVAKAEVKSLPIGISDYVRAQEEYYYVDKTLLIKEFLDQKPLVSLFTRPRRFGKTLNMDMLRVFFEISDKNTSKYFVDKNIWQCGEEYRSHQGKYPVIFLTFKDVKFDTWDATIDKIRGLLQEEYGRHQELLNSDKLSQYEKEYFTKIISATANEVELTSSLERLSKMLASHYDKAPVIIIDEYDTPIQEGYSKDFYNEIIGFMRNFFSGAFKDNKNLSYGFLTGILRIAQESIFSGLNNLTVNSVMDEEYDSFFGFTESEVKAMLSYYGVSDKEEELKDWYDGYLFGSEEIYNPWSVINYISKGCLPQAYWVNTGKNEILDDVLRVATDDITERLYDLLQGERVVARIDQNVVYRSLAEDPANIYSLLLVAGYLKTPKKELQADGSYLCEVSIPNREIAAVYKSEILSHFLQTGAITRTTANKIAESLYANDYKKLQSVIGEYMDKSISFFDGGAEGFYHGLVLGLIALMDNQYRIKSNRELGDGRYDICMFPRECKYPGIIMELKWQSGLGEEKLEFDWLTGGYVGYCAIKNLNKPDWELGIELKKEWCHKGYGTEAVSLFLKKVATLTGKRFFRARVDIENVASQAMMKKLGAYPNGVSEFLLHGQLLEEFKSENIDKIDDNIRNIACEFKMTPEDILGYVLEYRIDAEKL